MNGGRHAGRHRGCHGRQPEPVAGQADHQRGWYLPAAADRPNHPIVAGVAVAVGTPGALLAGQAGHPLYGYLEIADLVESARDSGKWRVDGGAHTGDGIHPNVTGHLAMVPGVDLTVLADVPLPVTTGAPPPLLSSNHRYY